MTMIVFEMNVEDIRVARVIYNSLIDRGVPSDRIMPIVSRYRGRKEPITLKDVQRTIGAREIAQLSNDFKTVDSCVNYGKLLAEQGPRSTLRKEIQELAERIRRSTGATHQLTAR